MMAPCYTLWCVNWNYRMGILEHVVKADSWNRHAFSVSNTTFMNQICWFVISQACFGPSLINKTSVILYYLFLKRWMATWQCLDPIQIHRITVNTLYTNGMWTISKHRLYKTWISLKWNCYRFSAPAGCLQYRSFVTIQTIFLIPYIFHLQSYYVFFFVPVCILKTLLDLND